jgi:GNAT superfamily N-acetyltransferase
MSNAPVTAAVAVVAARPAELDAVRALVARSGLPVAGIEACGDALLVARAGGELVGAVGLELYGAEALLRSLAVDPARRGERLGERLVEAALDLARARGVRRVWLLTDRLRTVAGALGIEMSGSPARRRSGERSGAGGLDFDSRCGSGRRRPGRGRGAPPRG